MRGQPQPDFHGRSAAVLEKELAQKLPEFVFSVSFEKLPQARLKDISPDLIKDLSNKKAQSTWLIGRQALFQLAEKLSLDPIETMFFKYPHKNISLTHKADVAVALYCGGEQLGVGVDFEPERKIPVAGLQHFLSKDELRFLESSECDDATFLALWTVKEALFKALPDNEQILLLDIELEDLSLLSGRAFVSKRPELVLSYQCVPFKTGFLSVASAFEVKDP